MNRDAFLLEEHLVECRFREALRLMFDEHRRTSEGALAELLEQTAAVLRLRDASFDEYCAARMNVDPEFEARIVALLGPVTVA